MRTVRDLSILVARVGIGIIFLAYGFSTISGGIGDTAATYAGLGIPAPEILVYVVLGVEILGGAALVVGLLTPLAALLLTAVVGLTAYYVPDASWQMLTAFGAATIMLAGVGAGRFSLDAALGGGVTAKRA